MTRTYVVTGAASGIGAATADRLAEGGARVIRCDIRDADVLADLATKSGRAKLVSEVEAMSGGALDGVVAVAGIGKPDPSTVRVNFFGAVAVLEGLLPLLRARAAPRAVVVSSLASIMPADEGIVAACLAGDENAAVAAAEAAVGDGKGRVIYGSTKRAINRWVRRTAPTDAWAGAGIPLNAVAPGVVDTPAAGSGVLDDPATRATVRAAMPQPLGFPGAVEPVASLLAWMVGPDNSFVSGQVVFADGGADAILRGERTELGEVRYGAGRRARLLVKYLASRLRRRFHR